MRIAICDDNPEDLEHIHSLTRSYFDKMDPGSTVDIDCYTGMQDLLAHMCYDVYLLDILIGKESGIQLAKVIREKSDLKSEIIFTTSSRDFALDAFSVYAKQYLLKPVKQEELYKAFDQIEVKEREEKQQTFIAVKIAAGMVKLSTDEIICVEYTARTMIFHRKSEKPLQSIYIRSSFEENVRTLLQLPNFVQTHKSFVINMDYVQKYHQNEILLQNEQLIPVSRSNAGLVKRQYLQYLAKDFKMIKDRENV